MKIRNLTVVVFTSLAFSGSLFGQAGQSTENKADQTLRGSGRVNPSTRAMEFDLPLGAYPGRGVNIPITVSYSSKVWRMDYVDQSPGPFNLTCVGNNAAVFSDHSASGWTSSLDAPFIEYTGVQPYRDTGQVNVDEYDSSCTRTSYPGALYVIKRVVFHLPGGETHELRKSDTPEAPTSSDDGTYYSVDSSNIVYVEDSVNGVYRVKMPDGSRYDLANSSGHVDRIASTYTDRNGNYTTFHSPATGYPNGYWTDTLGRTLPLPISPAAPSTPQDLDYYLPGIDGNVTYTFKWKKLKDSTASESALTDFNLDLAYEGDKFYSGGSWQTRTNHLFASEGYDYVTGPVFNPILLTEIDLPTGQKYKFSYNLYGEIDHIEYPTGGMENFTYEPAPTLSELNYPAAAANRGVSERKVFTTSSTSGPHYDWTYASTLSGTFGLVTRVVNPDGTSNERSLVRSSVDTQFGFDDILVGMPFKELTFSSDGHLVSQKLTRWVKSTTSGSTAQRHPRVENEETVVYDMNGNGVSSTTTYEYEGDLTQKETPVLMKKATTYAFEAIGSTSSLYGDSISPGEPPDPTPTPVPTPTPSTLTPVKIVESTHLIYDPNYSSVAGYYTAQNMVGLVTESTIKNGSGTVVGKSITLIDDFYNYPVSTTPSWPGSTGGQWTSPANGYRGNPNTLKVWDSTEGAYTNSAAYISTHAQFDTHGNQIATWDALGNQSTVTFDTSHLAFPVSTTSPIPDQTSGSLHGSSTAFVSYATFDTTTGLPLTSTDPNGLRTEIEYDATTLRPRYTRTYDGSTQVGATSETIYQDDISTGPISVKNRSQIDADHWAESTTYFDGLGRAWKSEELNSAGNIFIEKEFDSDGRVLRATNPFRTGETKQWTTNVYDTASRVVEIDLPDGSSVHTTYGVSQSGAIGVAKGITDQAGNKRTGITDVLGNMIRVIEDPDHAALVTDYTFDTTGNLRKTSQSGQYRYFMHDSLGRLLYAKQVEQSANSNFSGSSYADPVTSNNQWSVKYAYDDNGNVISTTDARNVSITASYDHLNRLYFRDYSDSTPDVSFYYDGKGLVSVPDNSNGKTTKVTSSASESKNMTFDIFGRVRTARQSTDGRDFDTEYVYNLSGALIEETYPSQRKVQVTLNQNGDLSQVQSKKDANHGYWTYANNFSRDSAGNVTKMQLGNFRWETASFNNRQQVTQIGLGSLNNSQDLLKLEYSYATPSTTNNNGSLREQKITVPTVGSTSGFTATQSYAYDYLNRLGSATETVSSTQTWKQTFSYDAFGNRRFDTSGSNTTTLGSCTTAVCNPTIDTSNNRFSSGQGYTYDADGNLTQDAEGKRFAYDAESHQVSFFNQSNSGATPDATYVYDGQGKRVKKISSTEETLFVYDAGGQLIAEYSTAPATTPQVSYLTTDHLGSTRVITNENGAVTSRKDYSAFGEETVSSQRTSGLAYSSAEEPRKGYTGYEKDQESGLDFAQARYYNSSHGRFTSVDPMIASATIKNPQTFNRYSYVLNSPYKFSDPMGLLPLASYSGACGSWCQNSGTGDAASVDGSAFRGNDATDDWAREFFGSVTGYALDQPDGSTVVENLVLHFARIFGRDSSQTRQAAETDGTTASVAGPPNYALQTYDGYNSGRTNQAILNLLGINSSPVPGLIVKEPIRELIAELRQSARQFYQFTLDKLIADRTQDGIYPSTVNRDIQSSISRLSSQIVGKYVGKTFGATMNGRTANYSYSKAFLKASINIILLGVSAQARDRFTEHFPQSTRYY